MPAVRRPLHHFERVQLRELTIVKRTGRRQPFEREKLARSISLAIRKRPVDPDQLERMISGIVRQLESMGETEIPSTVVGEMVMKALKALDDVAYVRYASVYRDLRQTRGLRPFPRRGGPERGRGDRKAGGMKRLQRNPLGLHAGPKTLGKAREKRYERLMSLGTHGANARSPAHKARSVARLAAVQALYQMETGGAGVEAVIREFGEHRFDRDMEGASLAPADEAYFAQLVRGVVAEQARLDEAIRRRLADGLAPGAARRDAARRPSGRRLQARRRRRAGLGRHRRVCRDRQLLLRRARARICERRPGCDRAR